ncbi:MAG TPA: peptidoglycan editing factor PgeF [Stellaceae bacterium]|nr:peptidoglycan editing factor PgeF [Stellaceae bacterium]
MTPLAAHALAGAGVRHGFFTREDGVSDGVFAGLNCSLGSGDDPAKVAENHRRALACLGLAPGALVTGYQVHGTDVAVVERAWRYADRPRVDGLVTRAPRVALGILTADCAPVLFAEPAAGVVAAAHAGWRGAIGGVLETTLATMEKEGARRERIAAAIGPCIGGRSYEVGPEFPAPFLAERPENARFFAPAARAGNSLFDLGAYVEAKLKGLGVGRVERIAADTCADDVRFYSYRRACLRGEKQFGHLLSAIALVP